MATLGAAAMTFEEQAMGTHDPVNPFVVRAGCPSASAVRRRTAQT